MALVVFELFAGDVIVTTGACESRTMMTEADPLLPAASLQVTVIVLLPDARLTVAGLVTVEDIIEEVAGVYPRIMQQGDMEAGAWSCGMVAGLIHDVPTVKELGFPVVSSAFGGLFAPKGLPADIAKKIDAACEKVATDERYRRAVRQASQEPVYRNGAEFARMVAEDFAIKGEVVRKAGIKGQ